MSSESDKEDEISEDLLDESPVVQPDAAPEGDAGHFTSPPNPLQKTAPYKIKFFYSSSQSHMSDSVFAADESRDSLQGKIFLKLIRCMYSMDEC